MDHFFWVGVAAHDGFGGGVDVSGFGLAAWVVGRVLDGDGGGRGAKEEWEEECEDEEGG